ncbi:MAG: hypothetical protein IJF87_08550 [Erysipelotrichaceae bacterium]|nr:hypothetical protein [Erysipelotrichaceae bacterium]
MRTIAETKFIGNQALVSAPVPFNLDDGEYLVSIEPKKKKRSLDQNRYFWKLVGEIAKKENGNLRDVDELYTNLLQMSGAKYESVIIKHEALERFRSLVRHVKIMKQQVINHELYDTVWAFYGSSQFDTSEMAQLIDTTLRYAEEAGVPDVNSYWKGLLND